MRDSTSTSPLWRAAKRWAEVSGVKRTCFASPSTAAAIARHTSTSRPRHSPCASGVENPATPVVTPHCTNFLRRTASSVGVAVAPDPRACAGPPGTGAVSWRGVPEHADRTTIVRRTPPARHDANRMAFRTVLTPHFNYVLWGVLDFGRRVSRPPQQVDRRVHQQL